MSRVTALPAPHPGDGLRARKRQETHQRIADEAARLVTDRGVAGTTVDDIAAAAHVGRATFFRYFDTKEVAVAEGFTTPWLTLIVRALEAQPPHLGPLEAVVAAFSTFTTVLEEDPEAVRRQAELSQSSPGLQAWTLQLFTRCERAIADHVAARLPDLTPGDPRPLMIGALTMAAVRLSTDQWLAEDAKTDLAALVRNFLTCLSFVSPAPAVPEEVAL